MMSIVKRRANLLLAGLLCAASSAPAAQSRTPVNVVSRLEAHRFRVHFASDLQLVEAQAAEEFAGLLAREIGFLRFVVMDSTAPYRLVFILDHRERGIAGPFPEFGFWVRLEQPDSTRLERYWLPFRTAEQATAGVGTDSEFLGELRAKLAHVDVGILRDSLLRPVPIAKQALLVQSPIFGWALAAPQLDLCMRNQSQLELRSDVVVGGMRVEKSAQARVIGSYATMAPPGPGIEAFLGGAFSEPVTPAIMDEWSRLAREAQVSVKEVYVTSYIHDPNACRDRGRGDEQ